MMFQRQLRIHQRLQPRWLTASTTTPSSILRGTCSFRRGIATEAGDNKSGHITTDQNQGVIFFTNLLPVNLRWFFRVPWVIEKTFPDLFDQNRTSIISAVSPQKVLKEATQDGKLGDISIVETLPRLREGGAFIKFNHDASTTPSQIAAAVIEYLKANKVAPWWEPFSRVRAGLVQGKPWVEDLYRLPCKRIRVEFMPTTPGGEVAELTQEELYSFFRPYGKLTEITPQPSDSKVLPKYAILDFHRFHKAIMAKNCLHGYTVKPEQGGGKLGTVFRLTYEQKSRAGWFKDFIFGHPRIVIPIVAALVAAVTVAIFDPIRTMSIKAHITRAFHVEDYPIISWVVRRSKDVIDKIGSFNQKGYQSGMQVVWDDRKDEIEQLQAWLMETADTFIVVQGPRGSGKKELVVEHALEHKRKAGRVLVIDCKPIQEARGDSQTIAAAAQQVGYRPVFSWMNSISGLIDLAAQGATGMKTGFSETLENQLSKIWNNTASALKSIALDSQKNDEKDAKLSEDEYLDTHPERRPVVVIENFLHKANEPGAAMVYDKLAEWAARLTTSNIAHVIFLTTDVSFSKSLSKALPDRTFRQFSLGDCAPEVAKRYVINHLDFDAEASAHGPPVDVDGPKPLTPSQKRKDLMELDGVLGLLGGRIKDLEFLARRIKAGETPNKAVNEIIDQSASEILKMFLLPTTMMNGTEERQFNAQQAWTIVKALATDGIVRFNELLLNEPFKTNGERAITALEQAELITVQSANGRPTSIKPGRPVYHAAFQRLVDDTVLAAKMDLAILSAAAASEAASISKMESELDLLGKLPKQPGELTSRLTYCLRSIATSQDKIESLEKKQGELKKVLQTQY